MIIINVLLFAILFHLIGGWIPKLPRFIPVGIALFFIYHNHNDIYEFIAYSWIFYCLKLLPTNTLLSAINGKLPSRKDGKWQWMQKLALGLNPIVIDGHIIGRYYGYIRALPAIPAIIYLMNPWLLLAFSQGEIYFIAGWLSRKYLKLNYMMIAECVLGAIFGFCL